MNTEILKKYAELAVKMGVNIQKNDTLVINTPIETADFAREIAKVAYAEGAKDVVVNYNDPSFTRIRLENNSVETLLDVPEWAGENYNYYARNGAAFISISAADPDAYKGVSMDKIGAFQKARSISVKEYSEAATSNKCRWCVLSYPTLAWAKKVFPGLSDEDAVNKLGDAIIKAIRVDQADPIEAWNNHNNNISEKLSFLNEKNFETLHYSSAKGTDLTLKLPKNHYWAGGSEAQAETGILFNANMPTEEVFTLPVKTGVNGIVYSSKPLSYSGNLINDFSLTFKDGKVVDFSAKEGEEVLKELLASDDGAKYLGEVALVPYDSPISNSNIVFFNTLFDENAACHLALGRAYPCIKNSENMTEEELAAAGVNTSLIHVDFMIGTDDLSIVGTTCNGEEIQIFKDGNWAF